MNATVETESCRTRSDKGTYQNKRIRHRRIGPASSGGAARGHPHRTATTSDLSTDLSSSHLLYPRSPPASPTQPLGHLRHTFTAAGQTASLWGPPCDTPPSPPTRPRSPHPRPLSISTSIYRCKYASTVNVRTQEAVEVLAVCLYHKENDIEVPHTFFQRINTRLPFRPLGNSSVVLSCIFVCSDLVSRSGPKNEQGRLQIINLDGLHLFVGLNVIEDF